MPDPTSDHRETELLTITEAADLLRAPVATPATGDTSAPDPPASGSAAASSTGATTSAAGSTTNTAGLTLIDREDDRPRNAGPLSALQGRLRGNTPARTF